MRKLDRRLLQVQKGFTLLELLVVFTIIAIVATVTIASFVDYSRGSMIEQAATDVATLVRDAKGRTQSQVKPSSCLGTLSGYRIDICGLATSSCPTANTYRLSVVCSGGASVLSTKTLPTNISFQQSGTTSTSFYFQVLSNGVTGSGDVVLSGFNSTKTVSVGQTGTITVE